MARHAFLLASLLSSASASAGCRQLFGIDDTQVASDASAEPTVDAGPADARRDSLCTLDHLLCADFDTPTTGLGQFTVGSSGAGTLMEIAEVEAPSAPSILVASAPAGQGSAEALAIALFATPSFSGSIAFAVQVPAVGASCAPQILELELTSGGGSVVTIDVDAHAGELVVGAHSTTSDRMATIPITISAWTLIKLSVDLPHAKVSVTAGAAQPAQLTIPGMPNGILTSTLSVGLRIAGDHAACEVDVDDVVADPS